MNLELAAKIVEDLLKIESDLNETLHLVKTNCNEDEFRLYRKAVGQAMGTIYLDILKPLFDEHPSLIPPQLVVANKNEPSTGVHYDERMPKPE